MDKEKNDRYSEKYATEQDYIDSEDYDIDAKRFFELLDDWLYSYRYDENFWKIKPVKKQ